VGLVGSSNQPHVPWGRGLEHPYDPEAIDLPPYLVDTPTTRQALAKYDGEITYMDQQVGPVRRALDPTGQAETTTVLFLTEHGSNFLHCKWTCYDTGVRSAAVVRWPGVVEPAAERAEGEPTLPSLVGAAVVPVDPSWLVGAATPMPSP
jgi:uncharacterized sulfatase